MSNINTSDVIRAFTLISSSNKHAEVRSFAGDYKLIGWFSTAAKLVQAVQYAPFDGNFYIVLNPANEQFLTNPKLPKDKLSPSKASSDSDISLRCWLLLDFDPIRDSHTPSTDAEHEAALKLAKEVMDELKNWGWPEPVLVDSGNGAQLWYALYLPNCKESDELCRNVIEGLSACFSTEQVEIDTVTHNASRLARLPGTWNRKGECTPERPHRMAKFLSIPEQMFTVEVSALEAAAKHSPQHIPEIKSKKHVQWLEKWLETQKLEPVEHLTWGSKGERWIFEECLFGGVHKSKLSFIVRFDNGAIGAGCLHSSCSGKGWHELRDLVEPGWREKKAKSNHDSAAKFLVELAEENCELFIGTDLRCYAANGKSTVDIESREFESQLTIAYYEKKNKVLGVEELRSAIRTIAAKARYGEERPVYQRVANLNDETIYLDLATQPAKFVKIIPSGWEVVDTCPVHFRRSDAMAPLPVPQKNGNLELLKNFINYGSKPNVSLIIAWLLAALRGVKPFPILILTGTSGSAKSSATQMLVGLTDPAKQGELSQLQQEDYKLAVVCCHSYVSAFANVSNVSQEASDTLCRIASGEGFRTRTYYTTSDETRIGGAHPIVLNGIEDFAKRQDLLSRSLMVTLPPLPTNKIKPEKELMKEFDEAKPLILGVLLDAVAMGLKNLPNVKVATLPRMADFAKFIVACEPALWETGEFMQAYRQSQNEGHEVAFEASIVAQAVYEWVQDAPEVEPWEGTVSKLMKEIELSNQDWKEHRYWPKAANKFSGELRHATQVLASKGIKIDFTPRGAKGERLIRISSGDTVDTLAIAPTPATDSNAMDLEHSGDTGDCFSIYEENKKVSAAVS